MIQIDNISKSYKTNKALDGVSFTLQKGEIVGLLGVNGAGKSTLMKILSHIIVPDAGSISFFGKDFQTNRLGIKQKTGYLSEDNPLYEAMYVKEYLSYVADIYKADRERVSLLIEQTGLQKEYKKKINQLSKGNRQRVGIAQALINDPVFLILDEATAGLDPNQKDSLNKLLLELSVEKIILFSTHILSEVRGICSRFLLLDKGKLIAEEEIDKIESIEDTFHILTNENNS